MKYIFEKLNLLDPQSINNIVLIHKGRIINYVDSKKLKICEDL